MRPASNAMDQNFTVSLAGKGSTVVTIMAKGGNRMGIVYGRINKGPRTLIAGRQANVAGLATISGHLVGPYRATAPPKGGTTLGMSRRSPQARMTEVI